MKHFLGTKALSIGKQAENQAAHFLKKQGLKVIANNVTYKIGEIDLIAKDQDTLVFIEVKYRKNNNYGFAVEMVNTEKQNRIQKAALIWMQTYNPKDQLPCRFDVIAISKNGTQKNEIQWIKNAF